MKQLLSLCAFLALCLCAMPAFAQGTYVSAVFDADIVRTNHSDVSGLSETSRGGEALGFALRVGTPLGDRWGVEAEYSRPAEIETEGTPDVVPLLEYVVSSGSAGNAAIIDPRSIPIRFRLRSSQRHSTFATSGWVRQTLSSRVALAYLAGIAFHRSSFESESSVFATPLIFPPLPAPTVETIVYSVRPMVGMEARIGLTDHVQLVPGLRLHALPNGWILRPAVGLGWAF